MPEKEKMSRVSSRFPKGVQTPMGITILIMLVTCLASVIGYFFLPPEIPLWYSLALSDQHLATKELIFVLPAIAIFFTSINASIVAQLQKFDVLLIRLFAWITVVCSFLLLVALVRILLLVT